MGHYHEIHGFKHLRLLQLVVSLEENNQQFSRLSDLLGKITGSGVASRRVRWKKQFQINLYRYFYTFRLKFQ